MNTIHTSQEFLEPQFSNASGASENDDIENGYARRSCSIAQGTVSSPS